MKREEREYAEIVPDATRKARLEQQANTLLDLPKDVRKMIMIQLKPIDMYVLYSGVDNYAFKKWCDDYFWDYALETLFPDARVPHDMIHPRWRFFAYALGVHPEERKGANVYFGRRRRIDGDMTQSSVQFGFLNSGDMFVQFDVSNLDLGRFLIAMTIAERNEIPFVERNGIGVGRIYYAQSLELIVRLYYKMFELGYKRIFNIHSEREFLLGCHICGSPAVTGYSAEDPSKLLCGPGCTTLKK